MDVGHALLALILAVLAVMWVLVERTARHQGRRVERLQGRIREQRREIAALHGEVARYRTAHACLAPDAVLVDEQQIAAIETYANTREDGPR